MRILAMLLSVGLVFGCSQSGPSSSGSGGTVGQGGSSTAQGGAGGATGSGGTSATSSGSGGSSAGSGGSSVTATGGAATGGAMAGTGGRTNGGAGGATGAGGAAGAGGTTGGTKAGTGGNAGAGGATVGTGGAAGGPSGGNTGTGDGGKGGNTAGTTGTGTGGTGGGSGPCVGRVLSLSGNSTGSDSDAAYAHVEIDMKSDLPIDNAKRTFEFWAYIKSTDWVGEKNQIFYYGGSAANGSFGLDFGTNNVTGSTTNHATLNPFTGSAIRDDSGKDLGIDSSKDQWVHIAMTWDGTVLTTYVNGLPKITAQGSGSTTTLATSQSVVSLGCNPTNNNCFGGYFDELRVWNVARTASEIKDNYSKPMAGNEPGLVGYWKFDDAPGSTTAADSVTTAGHTAHPGTLSAKTSAVPTFVTPTAPTPLVCS
jgi:hypothetical protein